MKIKDAVSLVTVWAIIIPFWFIFGFLMSPFWLALAVVGGLLQEVEWKDVPRLWADMVTLRWFFEAE